MRSMIASFVSICLLTMQCLLVPSVHASMMDTGGELSRQERSGQQSLVMDMLSRDQAREMLTRQGVTPEQVEQRLNRLSDAELAQLAERADEMPAGEGALGVVLTILLILIILDLVGATDVFPGIGPINN